MSPSSHQLLPSTGSIVNSSHFSIPSADSMVTSTILQYFLLALLLLPFILQRRAVYCLYCHFKLFFITFYCLPLVHSTVSNANFHSVSFHNRPPDLICILESLFNTFYCPSFHRPFIHQFLLLYLLTPSCSPTITSTVATVTFQSLQNFSILCTDSLLTFQYLYKSL